MWLPSETSMSWAVTRTRSPDLRTDPSSRVVTPSCRPISRRSSLRFLKENDEVLPITFKPGILASRLRISSVRPSEKYSFSGSPLMFTKGSTAVDSSDLSDGSSVLSGTLRSLPSDVPGRGKPRPGGKERAAVSKAVPRTREDFAVRRSEPCASPEIPQLHRF